MSGSSSGAIGAPRRARRRLVVSCCIVAGAVLGYAAGLAALHQRIGNPAFLLGLLICIGAARLGIRGALIVIAAVSLIDRNLARSLPPAPELGQSAAAIAVLLKLVLAGGLGWVVDSRRRVRALNAELRREVLARQHSERSLQRSEAMQRILVESLGEGVGLFDADDRVVYANHALAHTLGVAREQLDGEVFSEFLLPAVGSGPASHRSTRLPPTTSLAASDPAEPKSYEVVLASNPDSLLLVTETRLEPSSVHTGLTLRVVRDLTERVLTERRQRELDAELQRSHALQSLAVMAGGVAHDFNNLLCGVIGNAQLALRKVPADAPPLLARCLTEIRSFAEEAAQLSKQMLAYAGRRSLAIGPLEVNEELSAAMRLLQSTVDSKARLVLELGSDLSPVGADRFQLRQVITNLVLNALDAMVGQRGTLTLRTETVEIESDSDARYGLGAGSYVKITVSDTGAGIHPDVRAHLFEPFFSTKGAGRGMGLAAAAGIVRAHRGWLGVEQTSASGTTFALLLPVSHLPVSHHLSAPAPSNRVTETRTILLIDDEPAVRLVTGRMLTELGHRVVTAETGRRGVELLQQHPESFDLVVLDLTMPEQSGEQTLAQLRGVRGSLPVVITSGFQPDDASALLQLPDVVGFLDKPHTLTNLESLLASVARQSRGRSAPHLSAH